MYAYKYVYIHMHIIFMTHFSVTYVGRYKWSSHSPNTSYMNMQIETHLKRKCFLNSLTYLYASQFIRN